jgi:cytochrome c-type biogenesis protein
MEGYEISYVAAVGGGLISFLSPCVLPIVPGYLCFLAGTSLERLTAEQAVAPDLTRRVTLSAVSFVLGFTTVFVLMGASASAITALLREHLDTISIVAGGLIVIFGLHYMGLFRIGVLDREARFNPDKLGEGWPAAYVLGLAFAFGWTPCIGPILATILTIAAIRESLSFGMSLLAVYSLGLGIPFILAAFAMKPFMRFLKRFRTHIRKVEVGAGALLVVTGVLILTNSLQILGFYLLEVFPALATIG